MGRLRQQLRLVQRDPVPHRLRHQVLRAALGALVLAAAPALGADPGKELTDASIIRDVVVAPIPISNPTIGTGLAVVVMPFYHLGKDSPLSNTAFAAGYTSSGSGGFGAAQSTRLEGGDVRIDGFLGYVELRYDFYGIGAAAGTGGASAPIVQKAYAFVPEVLFQVVKAGFVGARYRGTRVETALDAASAPPQVETLLGSSLTIVSSGLGPVLVYDTRDHEMSPTAGLLVDLRANFADKSFGSDFDYSTFALAANYYRRAGPGVLGLRGYACGVSQSTPLFDLCLYGAGSDLRGYEAGRYRDRAMLALQAEYRFPIAGRFGGVVFGGSGRVAGSFSAMGEETDLPSIGAGLRWLAAEKARVNLSVDVAAGRDSAGLYVYVKEAF